MSLYGSLFSGVTGLGAQSRALGVISENITNVNTVGFKAKSSQFATLVAAGGLNSGSVGGVKQIAVANVGAQGIVQSTNSATDIAISGGGFFVVNSNVESGVATGETKFTRAGHFAMDEESRLVNASGDYLMGWRLDSSGAYVNADGNVISPDPTSTGDLQPVDLSTINAAAEGTENIDLKATFPSTMKVGDSYTISSNIVDDLGAPRNLGFTFSKSDHVGLSGTLTDNAGDSVNVSSIPVPARLGAGGLTDTTEISLSFTHQNNVNGTLWQATVSAINGTVDPMTTTFDLQFDTNGVLTGDSMREVDVAWDPALGAQDSVIALDFANFVLDGAAGASTATAAANAGGPVLKVQADSAAAGDAIVSGSEGFISFNTQGNLLGPTSLAMEIDWDNAGSFADNSQISLNFGEAGTRTGLSVTGTEFDLGLTRQDGMAFGNVSGVSIDDDGFVIANFDNGSFMPVYRLALADFNNPSGMKELGGNAYGATLESGAFFLSEAGSGGAGTIAPQALEQSTVDIAREFTNMIITQRAFSSASTVITTSDEMLQELVQLKR